MKKDKDKESWQYSPGIGGTCSICKSSLSYNEKYDAIFCGKCNEWKELKCVINVNCSYCKDRPDKPINN